MSLVTCKDLSKTYGSTTALSHINLDIEEGHIIGLLGPNGSGKTTLIKILNGLLTPSAGEVYIKEAPVGTESKKVISYLPDHTYLGGGMRVNEIIDFFKDFYEDFEPERAYDMLEKLQIDPKQKLKTMSKGTKEKVQLILVMSRRADLYILDEPIAGVDPAARDYILNTIIGNYNEDATVLISTHLIADVEKVLDERTSLGILGDKMGTYTQKKAADALGDAARNTGTVGTFMGVGMGGAFGNAMNNAFSNLGNAQDAAPKQETKPKQKYCGECGAAMSVGAKFCPECGAKQSSGSICVKCGADVKGKKFCPECGTKVEN